MAEILTPTPYTPLLTPRAARWMPVAMLWQGLVALAALAGALVLVLRPDVLAVPGAVRWIVALVLAAAALGSVAALPFIQRRDHRGRVLALAVNYLIFVALFFATLHTLGVFVGLDRWAATFGRGLPFLAGAVVTFILFFGDRFKNNPARAKRFRQIGTYVIVIFVVIAFLVMGVTSGALILLQAMVAGPLPFGLTLVTVLFGIATWFWWRGETGVAFNATITQIEMLNGYLLLSPNLLGFLVFFAGPLLFSLYVSFTEWSAFGNPQWIGLANYREILNLSTGTLASAGQRASEVLSAPYVELTRLSVAGQNIVIGAEDRLFWIALRNTFLYCLMVVPLSVIPALLLSNVLNSKIPGMRFFRAIYFLPSVTAVVGVATIWKWLYNSSTGFINYGVAGLVDLLNVIPGVALADPEITWLSQSNTALFALVIVSAWRIIGFNTVLFLAGLQGISREIYEAASVDGAGTARQFRSITLPLLAPTTFFVLTTTVIQALQVFDEVFVMINPPAGPNNSTLTAVLYLYQNGFQRFNLGYASAVAWVLFFIIFLVTLVQFRIQRAGETT